MLNSPEDQSPETSIQPIISFPTQAPTEIVSTQRGTHRNKTILRQVSSKLAIDTNSQDIQLDVEDDQSKSYFKQDPIKEEEENETEEALALKLRNHRENNAYETYFKPEIFLKFFLMHMLFFFVMGPFIVILTPLFGKYILHNVGFTGVSGVLINQSIQYICIVSFLIVYYTTTTEGLEAIEIYMFCVSVLVSMIAMSSKYAYNSDAMNKLLHTTYITREESRNSALLNRWRKQEDLIIEEEVQSAILRLEIDSSLFFFSFLGQTDPSLTKKLVKKTPVGKLTTFAAKMARLEKKNPGASLAQTNRELTILRANQETMREDLVTFQEGDFEDEPPEEKREKCQVGSSKKSMTQSEFFPNNSARAIVQSFSHFLEKKRLETSYLFGYNLVFDLLKQARDARPKHLGKFLLLVSVIRGFLPTFYRLYRVYHEHDDIPVWTGKPYIVVILLLINILFFWGNTFTLAVAILDLKSKIFCIKQLGNLISPKKVAFLRERKIYPTLNIFDPVTLKTWSNVRRVVVEYGRKYTLRCNFNITITMIFYLFILAILTLQILGVVDSYGGDLLQIVFGYEIVVFFAIFAFIMLAVAYSNNQYLVHKNLLKKNKTILSDFNRLSYLYVGEDSIEPDNFIYREGLRLLREELGEENFEKKLIARTEKMTAMINDIIEELDFEELNEPFTVMGIPVTYSVLQALGVGLVSLVFALSQSFVSSSR